MKQLPRVIALGSLFSYVTIVVCLVLIFLLRDSPQFAAITAILGVAIALAFNYILESAKWRWQTHSETINKDTGIIKDFVIRVARFLRTVNEARQAINADDHSPLSQQRICKYATEFHDLYEEFDLIRTVSLSFESPKLDQAIKDLQSVLGKINGIFFKAHSNPELFASDSEGSLSAAMNETNEIAARAIRLLRQLPIE